MGNCYWVLRKNWAKQGVSKQVWFVPKNKWGSGVVAAAKPQENFYPHLRLQTVFPAINLPQNCYIMTIASPTRHIYPAWKAILTIRQNTKAREKILISQLFSEMGKTWKFYQELWKTNNSRWSNIQKSQFFFSL